jgi:hypothetical protein
MMDIVELAAVDLESQQLAQIANEGNVRGFSPLPRRLSELAPFLCGLPNGELAGGKKRKQHKTQSIRRSEKIEEEKQYVAEGIMRKRIWIFQ